MKYFVLKFAISSKGCKSEEKCTQAGFSILSLK